MAVNMQRIESLMAHLDTIGIVETYRSDGTTRFWRFPVSSDIRTYLLCLRIDWIVGPVVGSVQEVKIGLKYQWDRASWFAVGMIDMSWTWSEQRLTFEHKESYHAIRGQSLADVVLLCRVIESIVLEHLVG